MSAHQSVSIAKWSTLKERDNKQPTNKVLFLIDRTFFLLKQSSQI